MGKDLKLDDINILLEKVEKNGEKAAKYLSVTENEILSMNFIILSVMWRHLTKQTLPEFAQAFGFSEKKVQSLRNGNTHGKTLRPDMEHFCNQIGLDKNDLTMTLFFREDVNAVRALIAYRRLSYIIQYKAAPDAYYGMETAFMGLGSVLGNAEKLISAAGKYIKTKDKASNQYDLLMNEKRELYTKIKRAVYDDCDAMMELSACDTAYRKTISYLKYRGKALKENKLLDELISALEHVGFSSLEKIEKIETLRKYQQVLEKQLVYTKALVYKKQDEIK